jgi:putative transposase
VSAESKSAKPVRQSLDHTTHFAGRFGAIYFVTICCQPRGANQLGRETKAAVIFETARRYHADGRWHLQLLLLMPDHLHALVGIAGEDSLTKLIRDFKRVTARFAGIQWQRNFFDHRLRHDESLREKEDYIRENPIRAGLITPAERWPFVLAAEDLGHASLARCANTRAVR